MTAMNSDSSCADFNSLTNALRNEFAEVANFACLYCDPYTIDSLLVAYLRMANTNESKISEAH
jgi:hypothetical protein